MSEGPLTQEIIDNGDAQDSEGLIAKATKHPLVTAGLVVAGAGVAYAVGKAVQIAADDVAREVHVETSVLIDKSPAQLYEFWRDFQRLPLFMKHLLSVTRVDENKFHWVAKSINGAPVEWDAEVFNEKPNELIAWRSLEDADVVNAGTVRFEKAPGGRGTYVRVTMNYNPPAGKLGATLARLAGVEPGQMIKADLRRLKQLMEAGEIASIDGQSSGRAESATPIANEVLSLASAATQVRREEQQ